MSKGGVDSPELSFAVKRDISHIQLLCVQMDRLWQSIAAKSQRDLWKRKVEQVAEEAGSLKESLDMYLSRNQRRTQEARERAELLGRVNGESSHVLTIFDEEAQAMQSARNSSRMLEESYATGVAILSQYAGQRNRLKVSLFGLPAGFVMNSVRSFGLQQTPCLSRLPLYSVSIYSLSAPPINDRCIAPPHGFSTPSTASPSGYGLLSFLCFCICIRPNLIFSSASLGGIALQLTSRSAVSKCTPGFE